MRKEKKISNRDIPDPDTCYSVPIPPKYTHNMRAKRSTTVGNSIRENAKLPLQQPMMTVRGTAYISRTHGIRMHIQKKKYYQGTGWYRRTLTLPQNWQTKQIFLKLDAASKAAAIYMNGRKIGEHNGGYTACTFDITTFCSFDAPNSLAIHVDNARQDIPPSLPTLHSSAVSTGMYGLQPYPNNISI